MRLSRVVCALVLAGCVGGGGSGQGAAAGDGDSAKSAQASPESSPEQAQAEESGGDENFESMTPNEMHHVLQPCASWIGSSSGIVLMVTIDENGKPLSAKIGKRGFVAKAFSDCAERELMNNTYKSRGKETTIGVLVEM